ncbi:MAG: TonB-dependent receptor plug domain-containing protein [Deltaproteobacteria bacterium]|nr:TonB-dependent receptor plug domain-containing protein [Deltaproteobacteria bacterium]
MEAERPQWERILSPGSMSIVIPEKFKGEQKDLATLLEHVPGLFIQRVTGNGQYTTVRIRGSSAAQVNVYVDGVLQNLGNDIAVDISLIPVSQVDRIEVYRGYVPARFSGSPIGGVINVVTKKPESLGVDLSVGAASFNTQNYTFTATAPTFWDGALLLGAHYDASDNDFKFNLGSISTNEEMPEEYRGDQFRRFNSYSNQDFLFKWQNEHFSLKGAYKKTERELPYSARLGSAIFRDIYRSQTVEHQDVVLGYRNTLGDLDFGVQLNYLNQDKRVKRHNWIPYNGATDYPGNDYDYRETERLGGQADLSYKLGERHLLEFHADYSDETLDIDANGWATWSFDSGAFLPSPNYKLFPRYTERRWHLQLQDTITMGSNDDMKLTLILRRDGIDTEGNAREDNKSLDAWGVAFQKEINQNVTFRTSAGTFNRYPNFAERFGDGYFIIPTYLNINSRFFPNPTWERGEQWDVGLELRGSLLGVAAYSSIGYFDRFTLDMLSMYTNAEFAFYRNAGEAKVHGMEFEGGLYGDSFDLDASFTWQRGSTNRNMYSNQYTTFGEIDPLTNVPKIQYLVRGTYRLPGDWLSLFVEYQYTDSLYKQNWTDQVGDDIWLMDSPLRKTNAGLRLAIDGSLTLTAGVDDIFNKTVKQYQYIDKTGKIYNSFVPYPQNGRTYYATLEYRFDGGGVSEKSEAKNAALAAGEGDGRGGPFYFASKVIYSKVKTNLSGENWNYGAGDTNGTYDGSEGTDICYGYEEIQNSSPCYIFPRGFNYSRPVPGGETDISSTSAGFAFGVDFYKLHKVPIRLEVEASLHSRQNIDYQKFSGSYGIEMDPYNTLDGPALIDNFTGVQNLSTRLYNVFLNGYLDWHNATRFTPYIGGGVGLTHFHAESRQEIGMRYSHTGWMYDSVDYSVTDKFIVKERKWDFAWNFAIGCSYQLTDNTAIDISYRYVDFGSIDLKPSLSGPYMRGLYNTNVPFPNFYGNNSGQNLAMEGHQAVLAFRFDL